MQRKKTGMLGLAVAGMMLFVASTGMASASTLLLSYSETTAGTTATGNVSVLPNPSSSFYGNTFTAPTSAIPGAGGAGFLDDYLFTITSGVVDAITSTIDLGSLLGFSNIQVRLFNAAGQTTFPVLGNPVGGSIDGWSTPVTYAPGVTGFFAVIPPTTLGAGTYVLEVRGSVVGSAGGSYSGTLNLAPVPLPAAIWLLGSGIAGMLGFRRRRNDCAAVV